MVFIYVISLRLAISACFLQVSPFFCLPCYLILPLELSYTVEISPCCTHPWCILYGWRRASLRCTFSGPCGGWPFVRCLAAAYHSYSSWQTVRGNIHGRIIFYWDTGSPTGCVRLCCINHLSSTHFKLVESSEERSTNKHLELASITSLHLLSNTQSWRPIILDRCHPLIIISLTGIIARAE